MSSIFPHLFLISNSEQVDGNPHQGIAKMRAAQLFWPFLLGFFLSSAAVFAQINGGVVFGDCEAKMVVVTNSQHQLVVSVLLIDTAIFCLIYYLKYKMIMFYFLL